RPLTVDTLLLAGIRRGSGWIQRLILSDSRIASVGERHHVSRSIVRSVFRTMARNRQDVTKLEAVFRDAPALQHARRRRGETPIRDVPFIVLHIQVKPYVRIGPLHSR